VQLDRLQLALAARLRGLGLALLVGRLGDRRGAGEVRGEHRIEGGDVLEAGDQGHAREPVEAGEVRGRVVAQRRQEIRAFFGDRPPVGEESVEQHRPLSGFPP
jgi:hypothetical protein